MTLLVHFRNVGAQRKTWSAQVSKSNLSLRWLMQQVRQHQALGSRDVEFDFDAKGIYVGGFRKVGEIEAVEVQPEGARV